MNLLKPDEIVGTRSKVQMYRWVLVRCRWFQIVIHQHIRSDVPVLHDHEWDNLTIVLRGRATEWLGYSSPENPIPPAIKLKPGTIVRRRADALHWLELPKDSQLWTLFITGRKKRDFGYKFPNGRWTHWKRSTEVINMQRFRK